MTTKKAAFVLVDKSGCFSVKERLKVYQSMKERLKDIPCYSDRIPLG